MYHQLMPHLNVVLCSLDYSPNSIRFEHQHPNEWYVCVCVFIALSFECLPTVCVVCSFKMNWCRAIRRSHTRLLLSLVFTSHTQYDVNKLESKCVLNMRYTVTLFNLLFSFHSISVNSEKPFEVDYIVCTMDVRERLLNDLVPFC